MKPQHNIAVLEFLTYGLGNLVQAAHRHNCKIYFLTHNPSAYQTELDRIGFDAHFEIVVVNTFCATEVISRLRELPQVRTLVNQTDTWSVIAVEVCKQLNMRWLDADAVLLCRDKNRVRTTLYEAGLSKGHSFTIDTNKPDEVRLSQLQQMAFPLIIKKPDGTGKNGVWFVNDVESCIALLKDISNQEICTTTLMAETFFKGTLYSAETLTYQGETKLLAITGREMSPLPQFREDAFCLPIQPAGKLAKIEAFIQKVLAAISWQIGFAHTEFLVTEDGFEIIEINPRLGGSLIGQALCDLWGVNIYEVLIELALEKRPKLLNQTEKNNCGIGMFDLYVEKRCKFNGFDTRLNNESECYLFQYLSKGSLIEVTKGVPWVRVGTLYAKSTNLEQALLTARAESARVSIQIDDFP